MKILSIHKYYADRDGASHYQLALNRFLEARGHRVVPFAMRDAGNLPTSYERYFVSPVQTEYVHLGWQGLKTFGRMLYSFEARRQIGALLEAEPVDVAHVHNIYTQISPSIFAPLRAQHVPIVLTVHDYHLVSPNYMLWAHGRVEHLGRAGLWRNTFSRFHKHSFAASFAQAATFALHDRLGLYRDGVDLFVCPSAYVHAQMLAAGFPEHKLRVLPHFVETHAIEPMYGGNGSVLFVGRFVEEKGPLFLIEVAARLPRTRFVFAGRGPLESVMRARAESLANVSFAGWADREVLSDLYRRASIVAVPSLWPEVFGLVATEAMAYGKAVVASDAGALPEIVRDDETGRICPAGDLEAWVETLKALLESPERLQLFGEAGRMRAETAYRPEQHVDTLLHWFSIMGSDPGSDPIFDFTR